MKAIVVSNDPEDAPTSWRDWPDPENRPGWVVVEIVAAALNRNDAMTITGRARLGAPAVIGSDGAGVIASVGTDVENWQVGDEVVILPSLWWGVDERFTDDDFEILGDTTQGTLAQLIAMPQENVFPKPQNLSWQETAALPLAGLTAWRALMTQGQLTAGHRVLMTGASGGVASFAIMMASAVGAEVLVTTSSQSKLDAAVAFGATRGVIRHDAWQVELGDLGPFDVVLDSSGKDWPTLIECLSPGGTLVSIGRTIQNNAEVVLRDLFVGQRRLIGSSMGSPREFLALLGHVHSAHWRPAIDSTVRMAQHAEAFARLNHRERYGKVVVQP